MWKTKYISILIILVSVSSGCSSTKEIREPSSYWTKNGQNESKEIGVSLAGGGTKAASFSMGVLSALAKEDKMWSVDAISTVSGGSYAGLFLYSRLIEDKAQGTLSPERTKSYFQDCIPTTYSKKGSDNPPFDENILEQLDLRLCEVNNTENFSCVNNKYLHQQYVRCSQDIIERECTFTTTPKDNSSISSIAGLLGGTFLSLPLSLTANTIFDWPVNLSPSMAAYREGMGVAYAMHPTGTEVLSHNNKSKYCESSYTNCTLIDGATEHASSSVMLDPEKRQDFSDLAKLYDDEFSPPVWMLNATSAPSRSIFGWLRRNETDMQRYTFSMTPFKQGSNEYGDIDLELNKIDLLSASTASAAFFDANQTVMAQPMRTAFGVGQHFLNLSWGIDVPHPESSNIRRTVRSILPFPLYYVDYLAFNKPTYVRLLDGGSSDNLGAYRLIVDGFEDVIISDHAQDTHGRMEDLCLLRNELLVRHDLHLHMPGLDNWPESCYSVAKRSMKDHRIVENLFENMSKREQEKDRFYPIHAWPYPFLAGCVSNSRQRDSCLNNKKIQRVWLIKPVMDFAYYRENQIDHSTGLVKSCDNQEKFFLPCEASGFLVNNNDSKYNNEYGFPIFPQNGTVVMTINSSSTLYGAYKDLSEFYMSITFKAVEKARKNSTIFDELYKVQLDYPIKSSPDKSLFFKNSSTGDIEYINWGLEERNNVRKIIADIIFTK